jgi:hypothetical protein
MHRPDWQPAGSNFTPPPCRTINLIACGANCYAQNADSSFEVFFFEDVGPNSVWKIVELPPHLTNVEIVAAGPDSTAVFTNGFSAFRFSKTTYLGMVNTFNSAPVRLVGVGDSENFVFSDYYDNLFKYVNGYITQLPVANSSNFVLRQLACVSALDHIWAITEQSGSNVYYWSNAWLPIYGKNLKKIDLHYNPITDKLVVAGIDEYDVGWLYDNMTNIWTKVETISEYDRVFSLSTSNDYICATTDNLLITGFRGVPRY